MFLTHLKILSIFITFSFGESAMDILRSGLFKQDLAHEPWRFWPSSNSRLSLMSPEGYHNRYSRKVSGAETQTRDSSYWSYKPSYYTPSAECQYACDDGACLQKEYRCDGYAQCWDGSDEKGCSCTEIIGEDKICDGYKDCPDGKDEEDCVYGCQAEEFTCDTYNTGSKVKCIPMSKRCDGYHDCPLNNDEDDCFRMVDLKEETRGVRSNGILQKRVGNSWYTVCKTTSGSHYIQSFGTKACQQVSGYTEGTIKITTPSLISIKSMLTKQQQKELKFVKLAEIEAKFAVLSACASDRVYQVECPTPQCGGLGGSTQHSLRRRRDTEKDVLEETDDAEVESDEEDLDLDEDEGDREMIVGGRATQNMQWPFLVAIFRDGEFYCGGSIINDKWILTAAHCCHGFEKHVYEVQAGMTRKLSWSPYEQSRMVEEIYVHEQYDNKIFANDIALYKLDKPLHFSKYVTPACLPSGYEDDPTSGHICKVAGWGDLSESGSGPDHVQEVELPVLSRCLESFTRDTHQICAAVLEGGKDACQGDSGGPLLCTTSAGTPVVAGVVSFGRGCARVNEAGAYTRVSAYKDWIESVVNGDHPHPSNYPRPKQCTEKCYKAGGECIHPSEKCSGTVDCLGAHDEVGCTHIVTRSGGRHRADNGQQKPSLRSGQGNRQQPHVQMMTRANQPHPMANPASGQQKSSMARATLTRVGPGVGKVVNNFAVRKISGDCNPNEEFQCLSLDENGRTECTPSLFTCDRDPNCSDGSDEFQCLALSRDLSKPLSFTQMKKGEMKGYVMARHKGLEWQPLCIADWTLESGHAVCEAVFPTSNLESLETIQLAELAHRLHNFDLAETTVVKSDSIFAVLTQNARKSTKPVANVNIMPSDAQDVSKLLLHDGNVEADGCNVGYVKCKATK